MEEARLIDPAFWLVEEPWAPGAELPVVAGELPPWVYFRSSGSTGEPKWIGLSRESLLFSAAAVNRYLQVTEDEVWGGLLPLHHVGGFGVVARAFENGGRLARYRGKWDPHRAQAWLQEEGVSHAPMVPTQVHDLVTAGLRAPRGLRSVVVGGGTLARELGQAARDLGWPVLASYGMTKAGSQIATQSIELLGSPYQPFPIEVLPHWQVELSEDRLQIAGPALFQGMLKRREGEWRYEVRAGDAFLTSDRVTLELAGLTVLGRADRQVKILGELVDLDALERELGPGVIVLSLPEARRGQRLIALTEEKGRSEAIAALQASRPGPWRIDQVIEVEALPRTPLGKPDRAAARERLREGGA